MAKQRTRFFTRALVGMGVITVLAVAMPTPARAETIDLICNWEKIDNIRPDDTDLHVHIDTARQSVVTTIEDKHYGPFTASISDTLIDWTQLETEFETRFTIDRVSGTMRYVKAGINPGWPTLHSRGKCRHATQKF